MASIRQTRAALCGAALEGFNDHLAKHCIDLCGQARGAGIAHAHLFGGCGNRPQRSDMLHQFSFASAKANAAWRNHFQTKFQWLTHSPRNTMGRGVGQ